MPKRRITKLHIAAAIFEADGAVVDHQGRLIDGISGCLESLKAMGIGSWFVSSNQQTLDQLAAAGLEIPPERLVNSPATDKQTFMQLPQRMHVPAFHTLLFAATHGCAQAALASQMKAVGIGDPAAQGHLPEVLRDYNNIDIDFILDTGRVHRWPVEPWGISQTTVRPGRARYWETLFALTNGVIGLRGTHEEEDPAFAPFSYPGMFASGIVGYTPYNHPVSFPGYPDSLHVMLNLADWRIINLTVENDRFSLFNGTMSDYRRHLDFSRGVLTRELVWTSPSGNRVKIEPTRLVSMQRRHNAAIRYTVTPLDKPLRLSFQSSVQATVDSEELGSDQTSVTSSECTKTGVNFIAQVTTTPSQVAVAIEHRFRN